MHKMTEGWLTDRFRNKKKCLCLCLLFFKLQVFTPTSWIDIFIPLFSFCIRVRWHLFVVSMSRYLFIFLIWLFFRRPIVWLIHCCSFLFSGTCVVILSVVRRLLSYCALGIFLGWLLTLLTIVLALLVLRAWLSTMINGNKKITKNGHSQQNICFSLFPDRILDNWQVQ